MLLEVVVANAAHGAVALVWASGAAGVAGASDRGRRADLLAAVVAVPALLALAGLAGLPAPAWLSLRIELWLDAVRDAPWPVAALGALLFAGTGAVFAIQELVPVARRLRVPPPPTELEPRLDAAAERVWRTLDARGAWPTRLPRPAIVALATPRPVAAAQGIRRPTIAVSRGLLARLDDQALDATIAHELAHVARGGNARMVGLWCLRALQALSPAALIAYRQLVEAEEMACDALAAAWTGQPAALADALLAHPPLALPDSPGAASRARDRVRRRAELALIRLRVRALLDDPLGPAPTSRAWLGVDTALLGALLWTVG